MAGVCAPALPATRLCAGGGVGGEVVEVAGPVVLGEPGNREGVADGLHDLLFAQMSCVSDGGEILVHIPREICRVIGVDGDQQGSLQHGPDLARLQAVGDVAVGDGAGGQADCRVGEPLHERVVADAVDAVVYPFHPDVIQALPDVGDGVLLIDVAVHRQVVALAAGPGENLPELDRRVALLIGVQPYSGDPVPVGQGLAQGVQGGIGWQIPQ